MEWFKFRMSWRKPLLMLTDEEAGRVVKALVTYVYSEEEQKTGDRGDLLLCQMTETMQEDAELMRQKAEKKAALSRKRSEAGLKGARAKHAKEAKARAGQPLPAVVTTSRVLPADARVCHGLPGKNKNKEYKNKEIRDSEKEERDSDAAEEEDSSSCSEPPPAVSELPVAEIPLNDGSEYPLYRKDVAEYASLYPAVDVEQELRNIRGWCLANTTRRKTHRGVRRFINGWLSRAQDKGGKRPETPNNPFLAYARGEKEIGDLAL